MTHSLGNQKLCEKVAKMIMVHFATFFSQECLWQSGMCRDFGIWFMIWYKTDGLDLHLMYGNSSQAIEWLRQYEIWGQIISSTILANWFTDHWFKCLHGFITGLWLLYEALNVISLVLSSQAAHTGLEKSPLQILNWIIFWRNSNIELNQFGYRSPLHEVREYL